MCFLTTPVFNLAVVITRHASSPARPLSALFDHIKSASILHILKKLDKIFKPNIFLKRKPSRMMLKSVFLFNLAYGAPADGSVSEIEDVQTRRFSQLTDWLHFYNSDFDERTYFTYGCHCLFLGKD